MSRLNDIANPWIRAMRAYEPGKPIEEVARELGIEDAGDIVKLASNENPLGPSPLAVKAMRAALAGMHRYPDGHCFILRKAMAAELDVPPETLVFGTGSNELIELLAKVFLHEGTGAVVSDMAFLIYTMVCASYRAEVVAVPMKNFTHDLDAMLAAIRPDTRLVFVANPNNPTGTMVGRDELDRFIAALPDHVVAVMDEAYVELLPPELQPDSTRYVRDGRSVVLLRTFSKSYGLAGLRIGYAVAPPACAELLNKARQPFNVNAMAQVAAAAALKDSAFLDKTRRLVRDGLAFFEKNLALLNIPFVPSVANFMLADVGDGRSVFQEMQKLKVIVRPMDAYGLPSYIRITMGTRKENRRCLEALCQVLQEMRGRQTG